MSLSYRLYQIGRRLQDPGTNANITDSGTTTTESVVRKRSRTQDTYWSVGVGDTSVLPSGSFYFLIEEELFKGRVDSANSEIDISERGIFGTKVEQHNSGQTVYTVQNPEDTYLQESGNDAVKVVDKISDFDVLDISEVEEVIEREKGQFRISNVDVTVRGIGRHRLNEAGSVQKPWVFEVYNSSDNLIFQGFVRSGVKFNGATQKISFQAVSWLDILNKVEDIPARTIYETEVISTKRNTSNENKDTEVSVVITNEDLTAGDNVLKGDTLSIETGKGEIRSLIPKDVEIASDNNRRIFINPSDAFQKIRYSSKGSSYRQTLWDDVFTGEDEGTNFYQGTISVSSPTDSNPDAKNVIEEIDDDEGYYVITFDSNDRPVQEFPVDKSSVQARTGLTVFEWPAAFYAERAPITSFDPLTEFLKPHSYYVIARGSDVEQVLEKYGNIDQGDTVKILFKEAWGYGGHPTSADIPNRYEPDSLLENLFTVNDESAGKLLLGILPNIVSGVSYDSNTSNSDVWGEIDPRVKFPTKPIEAVRMIQQDAGLLLSEDVGITTNADGDDIPNVSYKLKTRSSLFSNTISEDRVTSWEENVSEDEISAVVVNTNKQYSGGEDIPEAKGWYYDTVKEDESGSKSDTDYKPNQTTTPKGEDVIEIDTNLYPSHSGVVYTGGGEDVRRDDRLSELAKKFYEHFKKAEREVEFELGKDNPDVLGEYIALNEGRIVNDSVLVTSKTYNLEENYLETSLKGRIGGRAVEVESSPKVSIDGTDVYYADSNDDVVVRLSGIGSWDPSKGQLSYTWEYKKTSDTWTNGTSAGTEPTFEETFTGVTSQVQYDVRLTVTNGNTGNSSQSVRTISFMPYRDQADEQFSDQIEYDKEQFSITDSAGNNERWGRVRVKPKYVSNVKKVEYRAAKGQEIPEGVGTSTENTWYEIGQGNDPRLPSNTTSGNETVSTTINKNGSNNVVNYEVEVQLDQKHVSNIQTRVTFVDSAGQQPVVRPFALDFNAVARVGVFVYTDENGSVYIDTDPDDDTNNYDVFWELNGGGFNAHSANPLSGSKTGYNLTSNDNSLGQLSDGDQIKIKIEPYNDNNELGEVTQASTFHQRNQVKNFGDLDDTSFASLSKDQMVFYDSSDWVNQTIASYINQLDNTNEIIYDQTQIVAGTTNDPDAKILLKADADTLYSGGGLSSLDHVVASDQPVAAGHFMVSNGSSQWDELPDPGSDNQIIVRDATQGVNVKWDAIRSSYIANKTIQGGDIADNTISTTKLSFDTATQTELNNHESDPDVHHAQTTWTIEDGSNNTDTVTHNQTLQITGTSEIDFTRQGTRTYQIDYVGGVPAHAIEDHNNITSGPGAGSIIYNDGTNDGDSNWTETAASPSTDQFPKWDGSKYVFESISSYTDEDAQDAVGNIMTGAGSASVNYDDAGDTITITATDTRVEVQDENGNSVNNNASAIRFTDGSGANVTVTQQTGYVEVNVDSSVGGHDLGFHDHASIVGQPTEEARIIVSDGTNNEWTGIAGQVQSDGAVLERDSSENVGVAWTDQVSDSANLGGVAASNYAQLGQNETITGSWTLYQEVTVGDGSLADGANVFTINAHRQYTWKRYGATDSSAALACESFGNNPIQYRDNNSTVLVHYDFNSRKIGFGDKTSPQYEVHANNDIAADGNFQDLSDRRVKTDIEPITDVLSDLPSGKTYRRTDKDTGVQAGLIAQEIEEILPEAVDNKGDLKTLNQGAVIALLYSAVCELKEKIE